jgi:FeS assembly protein IscX
MRLSWANQTDIAATLLDTYPDTDRLALNHDRLLQLIHTLPAFDDVSAPPRAACLDHILWTWMRLAGEDLSEEEVRHCQ